MQHRLFQFLERLRLGQLRKRKAPSENMVIKGNTIGKRLFQGFPLIVWQEGENRDEF